jgi:large subunit ribosomal protein L35
MAKLHLHVPQAWRKKPAGSVHHASVQGDLNRALRANRNNPFALDYCCQVRPYYAGGNIDNCNVLNNHCGGAHVSAQCDQGQADAHLNDCTSVVLSWKDFIAVQAIIFQDSLSMPKLKTHKGAAKRFKKTGTGKVKRRHAFARHILTSKSRSRKRRLGQSVIADDANAAEIKRMIPY